MIENKIRVDLKKAVKTGEERVLTALRMLLSAIQEKERKKRYLLSDRTALLTEEEITAVIFSEVKKREEAIKEFEKGKRADLVSKEKEEMVILKQYLPEQMSEEELIVIIKKAIKETGAQNPKDMGKVMAKIMLEVKGRAAGATVSALVNKCLLG